MYQFDKIKLIVWDLDETFWNGTLSEGQVSVPESTVELIKDFTDIGIVNSICSKNDLEPVLTELDKLGLKDNFVFLSVNWESKGGRVKQLIKDMQLRPANVLFLDDNHLNREEVRYFCEDIMVGGPEDIPNLIIDAKNADKKDIEHKRLKQYRVLETKNKEKGDYGSNEDFLYASNIKLNIHYDCSEVVERIHDLVLRANQLNFTKVRSSSDELVELFSDNSVSCGYIDVSDRFGDYGIVGFYALKDNELIHFVFSCRTLGMGIEQYVYNYLGRPQLKIVGEVISDLSSNDLPGWINQDNAENVKSDKMEISDLEAHSVLIKGPCDLYQVYPYISNTELFDTDFTHTTDDGIAIESTSHTTHIVESLRLTDEQKQLVEDEVPFVSKDVYDDAIFRLPYKVVIISILTDANLGVYQRKNTGERFAFLEYLHPMTDPANWDKIISGKYHNAGFKFTREILAAFSEKYEYIGRNSAEQVVDNLEYIRNHLSGDCDLCIMLGGELYYEKNTFEAYNDRHIVHKEMNASIRKWAEKYSNVKLIDVNKYLVDQNSFYDHFNHYIKPVYYALAKEIVDIVNEKLGSDIKEASKLKMLQIRSKEILAPVYHKILSLFRG